PAEPALVGEGVTLPRRRVGTFEIDRELLKPLVELGLHQLGDRALGTGLGAAAAPVGRALVVPPDQLVADVCRGEARAPSGVEHRPVPCDQPVDPAPTDLTRE